MGSLWSSQPFKALWTSQPFKSVQASQPLHVYVLPSPLKLYGLPCFKFCQFFVPRLNHCHLLNLNSRSDSLNLPWLQITLQYVSTSIQKQTKKTHNKKKTKKKKEKKKKKKWSRHTCAQVPSSLANVGQLETYIKFAVEFVWKLFKTLGPHKGYPWEGAVPWNTQRLEGLASPVECWFRSLVSFIHCFHIQCFLTFLTSDAMYDCIHAYI